MAVTVKNDGGHKFIYAHPDEFEEPTEGRKDDTSKDPWHLAPWDAFRAIVKVIGFGAKKYAPNDWLKGRDWSRDFAALQRHLTAWWEGESRDPESGLNHLWHAGACLVFLITYELRGLGTDDRPSKNP